MQSLMLSCVCAVSYGKCIIWQRCIVMCKVMLNTLSEADYTKKKKKIESKAALYIRATFIAICSKRQVSLLNWIHPSFHFSIRNSKQHSTSASTCFDGVRFEFLRCCNAVSPWHTYWFGCVQDWDAESQRCERVWIYICDSTPYIHKQTCSHKVLVCDNLKSKLDHALQKDMPSCFIHAQFIMCVTDWHIHSSTLQFITGLQQVL